MNRRSFIGGLLFAPAIIRIPGILMPIRMAKPLERCATMEIDVFNWAGAGSDTGKAMVDFMFRQISLEMQIPEYLLRGVPRL